MRSTFGKFLLQIASPTQEIEASAFVRRYATPLIAGLFAVSAISSVALFFHFAQGTFHEMHEGLSMVLLVPFVLHLTRN